MSDKKEVLKGMIWTAVGKYSPMVVSLGVTMILARILAPAEFGTVALAMVFISFLQILSSMGLGPAIIQRKDLSQDDLNNIFTLSCIIGLALAVLLFSLSKPVARFYENDGLIPVCQILSIQLFFSAINMVPNALMSKNLRFKENAVRSFVLSLITAPISVVIALVGGGIYALLVTPVVSSIFIFLYNFHFYPVKINIRLKKDSLNKVLSYSIYQFLFQVVNFFTANADKLIIGKSIGADNLGYYQKGYQLVQLPAGNITSIVYPVLHPIFSKYQDDVPLLFQKYKTMIRLLASAVVPMAPLLYFCGPEIIRIFYGPNWEASIPVFKIMSLALPIYVILPVTGTFFQSSGNIRSLFATGFLNATYTILVLFISCYYWGSIEAVAWAMTSASVFNLLCTYFIVYRFILHRQFYKCFEIFGDTILLSLILSLILFGINAIGSSHIIFCLLIKCLTYLMAVVLYIQTSRQFNIFGFVKSKLNYRK